MPNLIIQKLFSKLNEININYVVLRNYETLPHKVENDLDILVDPREGNIFNKTSREVFADQGYFSTMEPLKMNGMHIKGIKINPDDSKTSLCIHAQYWVSCEISVVQKSVPGLSYKVFIDNLQREFIEQNGCKFYIPSSIDRFGLLLRQWIFKRKPEYKSQIAELAAMESVQDFLSDTLPSLTNVDNLFADNVASEKTLKKFIISRWGQQKFVKAYSRVLCTIIGIKKRRVAPLFYISGPDGAGKTTISKTMSHVLKELQIKHRHFYSMKRNILRSMIFFVRRKLHGTSDNKFTKDLSSRKFRFVMTEDIADRDDGSLAWKLRKLITLMISISDIFINFWPVLFFRIRNNVVIIETSPYDIFIKYHMPRFHLLEKIFAPFIPSPTQGLILKADPDKIVQRKHELDVQEIIQYYQRLDDVLTKGRIKDRFAEVRTDTDVTETKEQVYKIVASVI